MAKQKQAAISYSPNATLIQSEGMMRKAGRADIMGSFAAGITPGMERAERAGRERDAEVQRINNKTEQYLRAMQSNIDVTGLTNPEQGKVNEYLMGVKQQYVDAANAIARGKLTPGTPEYMKQVDIMNMANNSMVNLKKNLVAYEEGKADYLKNAKNYSAGNPTLSQANAANIFTGEIPFNIGNGGNLSFLGADGNSINFNDMQMPFKKDYKQAIEFNSMYDAVYTSGVWNNHKSKSFETKLRAMAETNPDAMKSIIADGLNTYANYESLKPLLDDPANLEELTNGFINLSLQAAQQSAADGAAEKARAKQSSTPPGSTIPGQGAKLPTASAMQGAENIFDPNTSRYYEAAYGYDANGNTVRYYTPDGGKTWSLDDPRQKPKNNKPSDTSKPAGGSGSSPQSGIGYPNNQTNNQTNNEIPSWADDEKAYKEIKKLYPSASDVDLQKLYNMKKSLKKSKRDR